jgi:hypothetical protein
VESGEFVLVPVPPDPPPVDGLIAAEHGMRGGNFAPLAERYR